MWESLSIVVDAQGTGRTAHGARLAGCNPPGASCNAQGALGLGSWGWHHKPALAEVLWCFLGLWGGQCVGVPPQRSVSALGGIPGQAQPEQLNSSEGQ